MITVTLEKAKPKEKSFPKLMHYNGNIVFVIQKNDNGNYIAYHFNGGCEGTFTNNFHIDNCTDYNDPITIQNF
jgi:hypothetical protein